MYLCISVSATRWLPLPCIWDSITVTFNIFVLHTATVWLSWTTQTYKNSSQRRSRKIWRCSTDWCLFIVIESCVCKRFIRLFKTISTSMLLIMTLVQQQMETLCLVSVCTSMHSFVDPCVLPIFRCSAVLFCLMGRFPNFLLRP